MAISRDAKFLLLLFFNISSFVLCGWFGVQHVVKGRQVLNANGGNKTDGPHPGDKKVNFSLGSSLNDVTVYKGGVKRIL